MTVTVRPLVAADRAEWLRMRCALWPDTPREKLEDELAEYLAPDGPNAVLVVPREGGGGGLCGFVELSVRPWADGCDSSPVGYIEGWFVDPDVRRRGVGRALIAAGEAWARERGCAEMGSDAELWNETSQAAHRALGYAEATRLVTFAKRLL